MRELRKVLGRAVAVKLLDRLAHTAMKIFGALYQQAAVGNVLDNCMLEDVPRLGEKPVLVDDLQSLKFSEQAVEPAGHSSHPLEESHDELPADYGSELNHSLSVAAEPIETRHDDVLHGVGDAQIRERLGHPLVPVLRPSDRQSRRALSAVFAAVQSRVGASAAPAVKWLPTWRASDPSVWLWDDSPRRMRARQPAAIPDPVRYRDVLFRGRAVERSDQRYIRPLQPLDAAVRHLPASLASRERGEGPPSFFVTTNGPF